MTLKARSSFNERIQPKGNPIKNDFKNLNIISASGLVKLALNDWKHSENVSEDIQKINEFSSLLKVNDNEY